MDFGLGIERSLDEVVRVGVRWCDVHRVAARDAQLGASVFRERMAEVPGMTAARLAEYAGGRGSDRWVS